MPRRYKQDSLLDLVIDIFGMVGLLLFFYMVLLYFTDKAQFWNWFIYGIIIVIAIIGLILLKRYFDKVKKEKQEKRFLERKFKILQDIQNNNQMEYLQNFISRFGSETKRGWEYRNYVFDYNRLEDLEQILIEKGIDIESDDLTFILEYLIDQKEQKVTAESISKKPKLFVNLNGTDFERLIYRLFEAIGYKVEHIGHPKDQGGDLIINKGPERIVVQAKRYIANNVGNKAVQEAVAARNYYNCNGAIVITSSYFTREAMSLAKANNTRLINKKELQQLLSLYLKESWI